MNATAHVRLARGIRLRRDGDAYLMLVPEGIVTLNESAYAALELADGERSVESIAAELAGRFDDPDGTLPADIAELFDEFVARGYVLR
ncbi:MAG: pyrroloquinoline quinone biosynthesis peptide chaperone PqqD [Vulcanimicrobiaceae bacterium]